jgi:hypothetical protein
MEELWTDVADRVKELSSKPEKFLEPSDAIFEKTKILAKVLYDAAKLLEDGKFKNITLPELIIEDFDEEQVWAGVELQNQAWEKEFRNKLDKLETISVRHPDSFNLLRGDIPKFGSKSAQGNGDTEYDNEEDEIVFDDDEDEDDLDEEEEEVVKVHNQLCMSDSICNNIQYSFFSNLTFPNGKLCCHKFSLDKICSFKFWNEMFLF